MPNIVFNVPGTVDDVPHIVFDMLNIVFNVPHFVLAVNETILRTQNEQALFAASILVRTILVKLSFFRVLMLPKTGS